MTDNVSISQVLGSKPRILKVGKSFEKPQRDNRVEYNTIRYDFKPKQVDEEREGTLEVGENKSVAVSLPNVDGAGQTNYKGHLSQGNPKECVLIIDHDTGEITIERVSKQILLKKTRPEKADSKISLEQDKVAAAAVAAPLPNPYEVRQVPTKPGTKPSFSGGRVSAPGGGSSGKKNGSSSVKDMDSDFQSVSVSQPPPQVSRSSPVPHAQAKSRPPQAKSRPPPPKAPHSYNSMSGVGSTPLPSNNKAPPPNGSNLESSSSSSSSDSSSSSSDDDSDFEDAAKSSAPSGPGGMPTFGGGVQDGGYQRSSGVLPTARPAHHSPHQASGVLPTSRPSQQHHKSHSKSAAAPSLPVIQQPKSAPSLPVIHQPKSAPNLVDDLMLSEDSDSD